MLLRRVLFFLLLSVSAAAQSRVPTSVVFKLRPASTLGSIAATLDQLGSATAIISAQSGRMTVQSIGVDDLHRTFLLHLKPDISVDQAVDRLGRDSSIAYAEPNYIYHVDAAPPTNDSLFDKLWWLRNIHAPEAWEETTGDSTIHIGFVDTGVKWDHVDLRHQFAVNRAEDINHNGLFDAWSTNQRGIDSDGDTVTGDLDGIDQDGNGAIDDVIGYDFVDQEVTNFGDWTHRDAIPQDENGHGTFIAGILAAERNNHAGIAGIAPGCRLVALRAFDATGNAEDDDIAAAIIYAVDNGVKILNLSFGDIYPSLLQRDAIRYARSHGVVVFASSGNSGGDAPHYPSDFDEVISIGATTDYPSTDLVWGQTTHGEAMDLVAPGDDIWTTRADGQYQAVGGTSASSPMATGSAALLLSKRPSLTVDEVRSILASTAQDIYTSGYDHYSAHGRIDIKRALDYPGNANVTMTSVHILDAFRTSDQPLGIHGSAVSTLFSYYELSYAASDNPERYSSSDTVWHRIAIDSSQVIDTVLGCWNLAGLSPGLYTVRLAVYTSDRRTVEDRRVVRVVSTGPEFVAEDAIPIFIHNERGLLVTALTKEPARMEVFPNYHNAFSKQEDRFGREHFILFTREELGTETSFPLRVVMTDATGSTIDRIWTVSIPNDAVSQRGFLQKPYALPAGYALDTVLSTPTADLVAESVFPDGVNFGPLMIFGFDGSRFTQRDSLKSALPWIPRAIGSTRGDGVPELLLQSLDSTLVFRQNTQHDLLGDQIFHKRPLWGSTFADLNGDGKQEIVGYNDTSVIVKRAIAGETITYDSSYSRYIAYQWNGSTYQPLAVMPNPSPADNYNPFNRYGEPNAAHADLDGDGAEELITIDNDADLVVFKYDPSKVGNASAVFEQTNEGESDGSLLTTGDFDGDGRPDIAYAYHSILSEDTLREYPAAYWTLRVLHNRGNFTFDTIFDDHFAYARPLAPYHSSVRAMPSVTGHSVRDLGASFFPDFYLLDYDSRAGRMKPVWQYPLSVTARGAIAHDFDRNGKSEFGFVAGDSIRFFERDDEYAERTPSPSALSVTPRDIDRVDLQWSATSDAEKYYILRAAPGDPSLTLLDSSTTTTFTDSDVADQDEWYYAVQSLDTRYSTALSLPCYAQYAFVHPTPRIVNAAANENFVTLRTSEPLQTRTLTGAEFTIDDSLPVHSASVSADSTITLTTQSLAAGEHTVRAVPLAVRDAFNSPLDTDAVTFTLRAEPMRPRFYVVRWQFSTSDGTTTAHLTFNAAPGDIALDATHYTLTPYGSIERVYRDPADPKSLFVVLSSNVRFMALGEPFVLCVSGIEDLDQVLLDSSEANCAGISFAEQDLANAFVYPNPANVSDNHLTFAGLTPVADIYIYSLGMRPIRHLRTAERQGGVEWDLRDDKGKLVGSGEYLFLATGTNDAGRGVESKLQKFVVVRDE